jgi:hypothetical protein
LLNCEVTVTVPRNTPGVTSGSVKLFTGRMPVRSPVWNGVPSLSVAAWMVTEPCPAFFGSFTVTLSASSHS